MGDEAGVFGDALGVSEDHVGLAPKVSGKALGFLRDADDVIDYAINLG